MPEAVVVDFRAVFTDVLGVVETARGATAGWRTICVRARRALGNSRSDELSQLDLDPDVERARPAVRERSEGAASDIDTLLFGLFETIDDGAARAYGFHVAGVAGRGRPADEILRDPWTPDRRFLEGASLDALLATASRAHLERRALVESTLAFGAAALIGRFAAEGLARRIVIAFDEDHGRPVPREMPRFAEVAPVSPRTSPPAASLEAAIPRLLELQAY